MQIVRLDRDANGATHAWSLAEDCRIKMGRKLAAKGNERLPFVAGAVLGEGQVDQEAVVTLCEVAGINLRRRNIFVADCGSRDNIPDYVSFSAQLGLPYVVVMDADASKPDAQANAQAVRDAVKLHGGGVIVEFPENLEETLGVPKRRPSLVPDAIRALPLIDGALDATQVPAEIVELAEEIRRLAS